MTFKTNKQYNVTPIDPARPHREYKCVCLVPLLLTQLLPCLMRNEGMGVWIR